MAVVPPPSTADLADLALAAQTLFSLDDNRAVPGVDYSLDLQNPVQTFGGSNSNNGRGPVDRSASRLFKTAAPSLWARRSFKLFYDLLDNYTADTSVAERRSAEKDAEERAFLDEIMKSRPMRYAHALLAAKGLAPASAAEFGEALRHAWFSTYTRGDTRDSSCGFEHVFCGEIGDPDGDGRRQCAGLHSWIRVLEQEGKGNLNYYGFVPRRGGKNAAPVTPEDKVVTIQFSWDPNPSADPNVVVTKELSTMLMGSSPELEVALYSLFFFAGVEEANITLDGNNLRVRVYKIRSKYGDKVGAAFVESVGGGGGGGGRQQQQWGSGVTRPQQGGRPQGGRPQGGGPPQVGSGGGGGGGGGEMPSCGKIVVVLLKELLKLLK